MLKIPPQGKDFTRLQALLPFANHKAGHTRVILVHVIEYDVNLFLSRSILLLGRVWGLLSSRSFAEARLIS